MLARRDLASNELLAIKNTQQDIVTIPPCLASRLQQVWRSTCAASSQMHTGCFKDSIDHLPLDHHKAVSVKAAFLAQSAPALQSASSKSVGSSSSIHAAAQTVTIC